MRKQLSLSFVVVVGGGAQKTHHLFSCSFHDRKGAANWQQQINN
jgi:hypothetical protein